MILQTDEDETSSLDWSTSEDESVSEDDVDPETTSVTSRGTDTTTGSASASSSSSHAEPVLYQWLVKLRLQVLAKFTFFFHDVLQEQFGDPDEFKKTCVKRVIDYQARCQAFINKLDRRNHTMCMMFDATKELKYYGPGYHYPEIEKEPGKLK